MRKSSPVLLATVGLLGACQPKPVAGPDPAVVAARVEREFDAYCLAGGGDTKRTAAALKSAGWWEGPPAWEGLRPYEERLPGNRGGGGLVVVNQDICRLSRDAADPEAVAAQLTHRLAKRFGGAAAAPDGRKRPCADFAHRGATYSACYDIYPDAPATASLMVAWTANETQGTGQ